MTTATWEFTRFLFQEINFKTSKKSFKIIFWWVIFDFQYDLQQKFPYVKADSENKYEVQGNHQVVRPRNPVEVWQSHSHLKLHLQVMSLIYGCFYLFHGRIWLLKWWVLTFQNFWAERSCTFSCMQPIVQKRMLYLFFSFYL